MDLILTAWPHYVAIFLQQAAGVLPSCEATACMGLSAMLSKLSMLLQVMPYSTGCKTPLSNFEAGQNYKDVLDPAIMVRLPVPPPVKQAAAGGRSQCCRRLVTSLPSAIVGSLHVE